LLFTDATHLPLETYTNRIKDAKDNPKESDGGVVRLLEAIDREVCQNKSQKDRYTKTLLIKLLNNMGAQVTYVLAIILASFSSVEKQKRNYVDCKPNNQRKYLCIYFTALFNYCRNNLQKSDSSTRVLSLGGDKILYTDFIKAIHVLDTKSHDKGKSKLIRELERLYTLSHSLILCNMYNYYSTPDAINHATTDESRLRYEIEKCLSGIDLDNGANSSLWNLQYRRFLEKYI
jgi:hypothetical protein